MRGRPFTIRAIAWALGLALVAASGIGAAVRMERDNRDMLVHPLGLFPANDPLGATLDRCEALLRRHKTDPACDAAWAESRRRFFGTDGPIPAASRKDAGAARNATP